MALKKTGNWKSPRNVINALQGSGQAGMQESMNRLAEKSIRTVRQHIILQDLNWVALRKSTVERKGHADAWRNTGFLMDSIVSDVSAGSITYERGGAKGTGRLRPVQNITAKVGIAEGSTYPDGRSVSSVAKVLEEGGRTEYAYIYARPLFKPSAKEVEVWNRAYNNPAKITVELLKAFR